MALVLNGGVDGTGSTQYAYRDARVVSSLPCFVAGWFKAGTNSSSSGQFFNWVDADGTLGNTRMGGGISRSLGLVLTRNVISRATTASSRSVTVLDSVAQSVGSIGVGATTAVAVDDSSAFTAGEYVRITGGLLGLSGIASGRDYRIASIAGSALNLEIASSGDWTEGQTATIKWAAWQPEKWNFMALAFTETSNARIQHYGGFVGRSSLLIAELNGGTSSNYPADIFSSLDRVCLGATFQSASATNYFRGEAAHVAVWNGVEPTQSQIAELLSVAPNLVSWGAPTAYWPLLADETDSIGSADLTLVGTPDITSDGPSITLSGGGGGSGYLPTVMRAQPINLFGF
jgi:hypothetical protein